MISQDFIGSIQEYNTICPPTHRARIVVLFFNMGDDEAKKAAKAAKKAEKKKRERESEAPSGTPTEVFSLVAPLAQPLCRIHAAPRLTIRCTTLTPKLGTIAWRVCIPVAPMPGQTLLGPTHTVQGL